MLALLAMVELKANTCSSRVTRQSEWPTNLNQLYPTQPIQLEAIVLPMLLWYFTRRAWYSCMMTLTPWSTQQDAP